MDKEKAKVVIKEFQEGNYKISPLSSRTMRLSSSSDLDMSVAAEDKRFIEVKPRSSEGSIITSI